MDKFFLFVRIIFKRSYYVFFSEVADNLNVLSSPPRSEAFLCEIKWRILFVVGVKRQEKCYYFVVLKSTVALIFKKKGRVLKSQSLRIGWNVAWPWTTYLNLLGLSFLIYKGRMHSSGFLSRRRSHACGELQCLTYSVHVSGCYYFVNCMPVTQQHNRCCQVHYFP